MVHARGRARLVTDFEGIEATLSRLVERNEASLEKPWRYDLPVDFREGLVRAIVGFEIEITSIEGKFKLSQNRSPEDQLGALQGVSKHYERTNPELIRIMRETLKA